MINTEINPANAIAISLIKGIEKLSYNLGSPNPEEEIKVFVLAIEKYNTPGGHWYSVKLNNEIKNNLIKYIEGKFNINYEKMKILL